MNRSSLALLLLMIAGIPVCGQSLARVNSSTASSERRVTPATQAVAALRRLNDDVLVYRSLVEFETEGRLARVPMQQFENDLREVSAEVEPVILRLPDGKLKSALANALESYRDGFYWWGQLDEPRVVSASALIGSDRTRTPTDRAFLATIPYTVAIHWRQAAKYLNRAEELAR